MGCKLSVHVVHPESILKRFSPLQKTCKTSEKIVNNKSESIKNATVPSPPSTSRTEKSFELPDTYETIYIDSP